MDLTVTFSDKLQARVETWVNNPDASFLLGCLNKEACLVVEYILTGDDGTPFPPMYLVCPIGESDTSKNSMYRLTSPQGLLRLTKTVKGEPCQLSRDSNVGFRAGRFIEGTEGETQVEELFSIPADRETGFNLPNSLPKQAVQDPRIQYDGKKFALMQVKAPENAFLLFQMNDPLSFNELVTRLSLLVGPNCGLSPEEGERAEFVKAPKNNKAPEKGSAQAASGAPESEQTTPPKENPNEMKTTHTSPSPEEAAETPSPAADVQGPKAPPPPPPPPGTEPDNDPPFTPGDDHNQGSETPPDVKVDTRTETPEQPEQPAPEAQPKQGAPAGASDPSAMAQQLKKMHYLVLPPLEKIAEIPEKAKLLKTIAAAQKRLAGYRESLDALTHDQLLATPDGEAAWKEKYEALRKKMDNISEALRLED